MKSPKMNRLTICILGTLAMFECMNLYQFSFMGVPALLSICILFMIFIYFMDTWFCYGWGIFTGIVIFSSIIVALFNQSNNIIAYVFDGALSLFLLTYFSHQIYKKIHIEQKL